MASRSMRESTKRKSELSTSTAASSSSNTSKKRTKRQTEVKDSDTTSTSKEPANKTSDNSDELEIHEETGDIFDAPANTLIIHACNCQGEWGAGIAKAFKDRYPKAYKEYARHCRENGNGLLDSAQLIPPVDAQSGEDNEDDVPKHFIGCLYTSRGYGRNKDSKSRILQATKPAMEDLLKQVTEWNRSAEAGEAVGEIRICKINSGSFRVPWEKTRGVLETIGVRHQNDVKVVKVVSPSG